MQSGDIHPNPGPESDSSTILSSGNSDISLDMSKYFSFIHYNVQSLYPKLDILSTELQNFDILAFSETWLGTNIKSDDLCIPSFASPERKDRLDGSYGGVIIYVKNNISYKRRLDLEPQGIECIWIEVKLNCKNILFGLYYRPPSTNSAQHSLIEDSINLACDSKIDNIIITRDFNSIASKKKLESLCLHNSLIQCIKDPTHFTETTSSILDIIMVNRVEYVLISGVGDPFLEQSIRYHCPIYCIFH